MSFPYPRSPGQDLRDLFGAEQVRSRSRDLGRSSIRAGEGAIRVLNDALTVVVAQIGDLPGGGAGIGVPGPSNTIVPVQTHVTNAVTSGTADLRARTGDLETFKDFADRRIAAIDTTLYAAGGLNEFRGYADRRITSIDGSLGGPDGLIANRTWQDGQIAGHTSSISSLGSRMGSVEGVNGTQNTRLGSLEGEISTLAGAISSLGNAVSSLQTALNQTRSYIKSQHPGAPWSG